MDGFETLAALTRSPVRLRVLRRLREDGPANASELATDVEASRRTVSRALAVLDEEGLATSTGRTYRVTTYGELLAADVFELLDATDAYRDQAAFLETFPRTAIEADLETADGTVTCRGEANPHGPVSRAIDTLSGATSITVLAPVASPLYVRPLIAQLRDGADIEAVVDATAYDEFCTKLDAGVRLAATLTDLSLSVADAVNFGLLKCDETVVLGAYDDGVLQATFETTDEDVVEGAEAAYQRHRTAARQVIG